MNLYVIWSKLRFYGKLNERALAYKYHSKLFHFPITYFPYFSQTYPNTFTIQFSNASCWKLTPSFPSVSIS